MGTGLFLTINAVIALAIGLPAAWLVTQQKVSLQVAAGIFFVLVVVLVVFVDTISGRLHIANVKYVVLFGARPFPGIRDHCGCVYRVAFDGTAIILAYASLILFLFGFGLVRRPRATTQNTRAAFSITPNQLFHLSIVFYLLGFTFLYLEWQLYGVLVTYSGWLASETRETSNPMPYIHVFTQLTLPASVMAIIQFRRGIALIRKYLLVSLLAITFVYYLFGGRAATSSGWPYLS